MNHFRCSISLLLFIGFLTLNSQAQQYTRKESDVTMGGPLHDVIAYPGGDHIVITYPLVLDKSPVNIAITRYDPQLAMRYNNPLKALPGLHYRGAVISDHRFFLFCNDKEGTVSRYEIDDKTGQPIGKPLTLYSLVPGKEEDASFFTGSSPDKNFHYCFMRNMEKKADGATLQGVILDKKMETKAHFTLTLPEAKDEYNNIEVVLSDKGILSVIYCTSTKRRVTETGPYKYALVQVDEKGKTSTTPLSDLPAGDNRALSWRIQNDQVLFTGILCQDNKKGLTSVTSGRLDQASKKIVDVRQTEITSLILNAAEFNKNKRGKGFYSTVALNKSILLQDGSVIVILEEMGGAMGSGFLDNYGHEGYFGSVCTPSYSYSGRFWRTNTYVLKIDSHNTPLWMNMVSKDQVELDLTLRCGIASAIDDKNNLHLFFYDRERDAEPGAADVAEIATSTEHKRNSLACVVVSPDGKMGKKFMGPNSNYDFSLMPEHSFSGERNELFFTSIKTIRAFTGPHLLNGSDFRMGVISIKD